MNMSCSGAGLLLDRREWGRDAFERSALGLDTDYQLDQRCNYHETRCDKVPDE